MCPSGLCPYLQLALPRVLLTATSPAMMLDRSQANDIREFYLQSQFLCSTSQHSLTTLVIQVCNQRLKFLLPWAINKKSSNRLWPSLTPHPYSGIFPPVIILSHWGSRITTISNLIDPLVTRHKTFQKIMLKDIWQQKCIESILYLCIPVNYCIFLPWIFEESDFHSCHAQMRP